jgi:hypothetical protein
MAKAKAKALYGVIRPDGSWVFEPRYAHAGTYNEERIPVSDDGKLWGFADASGEMVIPRQFRFAYNFVSGGASAETDPNEFVVIDRSGVPLALWRGHTKEGRAIACRGGMSSRTTWQPSTGTWGYLDETGAVVVDTDHLAAKDFAAGRGAVRLAEASYSAVKPGKWAYLDKDGNIAIGPFDAWDVRIHGGERRWARINDGTWYFVDTSGTVVLRTPFRDLDPFANGFSCVRSNDIDARLQRNLCGYIDTTGTPITELCYVHAQPFAHGLAGVAVHQIYPTWGFIDHTGARVIEPKFRAVHPFGGDVAAAAVTHPQYSSADVWGLIDRAGAWVGGEPTYIGITAFMHGVARFTRRPGDVGLFDGTGKVIADGYAAIEIEHGPPFPANRGGKVNARGELKGGAWGFLAADGTTAVPFELASIASTFTADFRFATVARQ